jgi:hypothetical protein
MKVLLKKIKYEKYLWNIWEDLKIVTLLIVWQLGYTKIFLFCVSEKAEIKKSHRVKMEWLKCKLLNPGKRNVLNAPLVKSKDAYLATYALN